MDEVEFQEIRGMQRLQPLYNNTYRIRFLEGLPLKSQHLKLCGQVAGKVHLARVTRPHLGFTLDSMIDRLLADMDKHA
jgi:hypothetical protein